MDFFLKGLSDAFTAAAEGKPANSRYNAVMTSFKRSKNALTGKEREREQVSRLSDGHMSNFFAEGLVTLYSKYWMCWLTSF